MKLPGIDTVINSAAVYQQRKRMKTDLKLQECEPTDEFWFWFTDRQLQDETYSDWYNESLGQARGRLSDLLFRHDSISLTKALDFFCDEAHCDRSL